MNYNPDVYFPSSSDWVEQNEWGGECTMCNWRGSYFWLHWRMSQLHLNRRGMILPSVVKKPLFSHSITADVLSTPILVYLTNFAITYPSFSTSFCLLLTQVIFPCTILMNIFPSAWLLHLCDNCSKHRIVIRSPWQFVFERIAFVTCY